MTEAILANAHRLIAIVVLTAISGVISASETALFSLTRQQLNRIRHSKVHGGSVVVALRNRPSELLSTVLLCNIFVNILLYSILGVTAARMSPDSAVIAAVIGTFGFFFVLFGAEIIPKLVAFSHSEMLAPLVALPMRAAEIVTSPIRWVLGTLFVVPLTRIFNPGAVSTVGSDELQRLLDMGLREGVIDDRENMLLHQLLELSSMRVSSVMTPRVDVVAMEVEQPVEGLRELIKQHRLLRIPIFHDQIDNIIGIVSAKECLLYQHKTVKEMVRPVHYIPEQASCESLLRHFRQTNSQLAVVVDEYGGLAGIVAMEDVVEAIVGELRAPEERTDLPVLRRIDERTYMADATLDVQDFRRAFNIPIEETRINTLGGLIAQELDRVPGTGDDVRIGQVRLTVVHMRHRRIIRVRITLDEPIPDNPDLNILLAQYDSDDQSPPAAGGST